MKMIGSQVRAKSVRWLQKLTEVLTGAPVTGPEESEGLSLPAGLALAADEMAQRSGGPGHQGRIGTRARDHYPRFAAGGGSPQVTRSRRGLGRYSRPVFAHGLPSSSTTSAV